MIELPTPNRHGGTYESAPFNYYTPEQMHAAIASRDEEIERLRMKMGDAELCLEAVEEARAAIRKDTRGNCAFLDDDLRNWAAHWRMENDELKRICGESYQVVGILADEAGRFDDPAVTKALDNLSDAKLTHDDVLPFPAREVAQAAPVAWIELHKEADEIVRGKLLWKKFIDGTPLANDIACWMADFAQQHTAPLALDVGAIMAAADDLAVSAADLQAGQKNAANKVVEARARLLALIEGKK